MTFNEYLAAHGFTPENTTPFERTMLKDAYNAGFEEAGGIAYTELLRENVWLKQQIEKMKKNEFYNKNPLYYYCKSTERWL